MRYQTLLRKEKIAKALSEVAKLQLPYEFSSELAGKLADLFGQKTYTSTGVSTVLVLSCPHKFMEAGHAAMRTSSRSYGWKLSKHAVCVGDILDPHANDGFGFLTTDWDLSIPQAIFCQDRLTVYLPTPEMGIS